MKNAARCRAAVLLGLMLAVPGQARSLRDQLGRVQETVGIQAGDEFDALAENIADTAARSLPVISASAGFTYAYNPAIEAFERTSETLGPIFLERPDTLGRGKLNVNVSFQYVQFDTFDGDDLDDLHNANSIVLDRRDGNNNLIGRRAVDLRYSIGLQNYVAALSVTYGILDDLDVNLLVPVIATDLKVGARAQQTAFANGTDPLTPAVGPRMVGRVTDDATGIGDIFLRFKYRLPEAGPIRSAAGLQMRMPSGDEDDFQGTGSFELSPFLYASTNLLGFIEPHANAGVDIRTDDVERSEARYGVGVDIDVIPQLGFVLGFLGRSEFSDSADREDTLFSHLTPAGVVERQPLLGLSFDRKDYFDFTFGVRAVVWRNVMLFANGIYALNDDGLRNQTVIPTVGVEGTF